MRHTNYVELKQEKWVVQIYLFSVLQFAAMYKNWIRANKLVHTFTRNKMSMFILHNVWLKVCYVRKQYTLRDMYFDFEMCKRWGCDHRACSTKIKTENTSNVEINMDKKMGNLVENIKISRKGDNTTQCNVCLLHKNVEHKAFDGN